MSILNKLFQADETEKEVKRSKKTPASDRAKKVTKEEVTEAVVKPVAKSASGLVQSSILIRPVVTEKAGLMQSENKYVFEVRSGYNKFQIAEAVSKQYGVMPVAVNVLRVPSKVRVRKNIYGSVSGWRKAIVTLSAGKRISIVEGV